MQPGTAWRLLILLGLCLPAMVIADVVPTPTVPEDPVFQAFSASIEAPNQRFRDAFNAALAVRSDKIKQATDVFVTAVTPAVAQLQEARKKALATALSQYDLKIKGATQQGKLDDALKLREAKTQITDVAREGDERAAAEVQAIADDGSPAPAGSGAAQPRQIQQQMMSITTFNDKWAKAFPAAANLGRGGDAVASSRGDEEPWVALGGARRQETWSLNGPKGWFQASWPKPVVGQYVLIFGRPSAADKDQWGRSHIQFNGGAVIPIEKMGPQKVLIFDLGRPTLIRSIKIDFDGTDYPGFVGLEIHRDMKR